MSKALYFVTFAAGAVIGAAAAYKYAEKKYEQIAQEEINSVKATFRRKRGDAENKPQEQENTSDDNKPKLDTSATRYDEVLGNHRYTIDDTATDKHTKPYTIPPEEFGEIDGYETISLTYYDDAVLADDNFDIVENVEGTVGFESLNMFGEYEDDSVFVRNDKRRVDYEILLDRRTYEDVLKTMPYKRLEG